jgi:hypothetical protein
MPRDSVRAFNRIMSTVQLELVFFGAVLQGYRQFAGRYFSLNAQYEDLSKSGQYFS